MKKKFSIAASIAAIVIITIIVFFVSSGPSQGNEEPFTFPEMTALPMHSADLAAYQIPEDELAAMSSEQLLELVLVHPLNNFRGEWEDADGYYMFLSRNFNGMKELLARGVLEEVMAAYNGDGQGAQEILQFLQSGHEKAAGYEMNKSWIEPFVSEQLMAIDHVVKARESTALHDTNYLLQLTTGESGSDVQEEIFCTNGGYYLIKSSDGLIHSKKCDRLYYVVNPDSQVKDHVLLILSDEADKKYADALSALSTTQGPDSDWVMRIDGDTEGYYNVDGSENMLSDEEGCQAAVDAFIAITEAKNKEEMSAGTLHTFQWKSVEVEEKETIVQLKYYSGGEQMRSRRITTDYLINNFVVLHAVYSADYEQAVPFDAEVYWRDVYMLKNPETGQWEVFDGRIGSAD